MFFLRSHQFLSSPPTSTSSSLSSSSSSSASLLSSSSAAAAASSSSSSSSHRRPRKTSSKMVSTRSSIRASSVTPDWSNPSTPRTITRSSKKRSVAAGSTTSRGGSSSSSGFSHAPTRTTLFWLSVSLPLVIWDTVYVLLRPHTMEGGRLYWPMYVPYKLYGTIDHVYGWKAFKSRSGFTAAQGLLNLVETLMYLAYLYVYLTRGKTKKGARKSIRGKAGALATLIAFSAAVMTFSKTVLYWANEYFSGFANIGHNPPKDLVLMWIIPNGAWLVGSAYMILSIGSSILNGLAASGSRSKTE